MVKIKQLLNKWGDLKDPTHFKLTEESLQKLFKAHWISDQQTVFLHIGTTAKGAFVWNWSPSASFNVLLNSAI